MTVEGVRAALRERIASGATRDGSDPKLRRVQGVRSMLGRRSNAASRPARTARVR